MSNSGTKKGVSNWAISFVGLLEEKSACSPEYTPSPIFGSPSFPFLPL